MEKKKKQQQANACDEGRNIISIVHYETAVIKINNKQEVGYKNNERGVIYNFYLEENKDGLVIRWKNTDRGGKKTKENEALEIT